MPINLQTRSVDCLLYTSDAADEERGVDRGGRRIIKQKHKQTTERQGKDKIEKQKQR